MTAPDYDADARLKARIDEALNDPRPSMPAAEAFGLLDERIADYKAKHGRRSALRRNDGA